MKDSRTRKTTAFETVSYGPFKGGWRVRIDKDRTGALSTVFYSTETRAKEFTLIVAMYLNDGLSRREAWAAAWRLWESYDRGDRGALR